VISCPEQCASFSRWISGAHYLSMRLRDPARPSIL
jgi:hypothetical protein